MFLLRSLRLARTRCAPAPPSEEFADRRRDARNAVFHEAVLQLEDYYAIRAVITDLSEHGARVQYFARQDLPFRVRVSAATLKLKCWARVRWQKDGAAGLEFLVEA